MADELSPLDLDDLFRKDREEPPPPTTKERTASEPRRGGPSGETSEWLVLMGQAVEAAKKATQILPASQKMCTPFADLAGESLGRAQGYFTRERARAVVFQSGAAWGCSEAIVRFQEMSGRGKQARKRLDGLKKQWLSAASFIGLPEGER